MSAITVAVIDYQSGNLHSVARALHKVGAQPLITGDYKQLLRVDAAILPGVGSGPAAMDALRERDLVEPIKEYVALGKPLFGVCMGMQLLLERTEEGDVPCLGLIPGQVRRLPQGLKIPHMGWNEVNTLKDHAILQGVPQGSYFYFVHSYYPNVKQQSLVLGTTEYGTSFCSVLAQGNVIATQFHPEKSGPVGIKMYENFVRFAVS